MSYNTELPDKEIKSVITLDHFDNKSLKVFCTDKSYKIRLGRMVEKQNSQNYFKEEEETVIEKSFPFTIQNGTATVKNGKLTLKFDKVENEKSDKMKKCEEMELKVVYEDKKSDEISKKSLTAPSTMNLSSMGSMDHNDDIQSKKKDIQSKKEDIKSKKEDIQSEEMKSKKEEMKEEKSE